MYLDLSKWVFSLYTLVKLELIHKTLISLKVVIYFRHIWVHEGPRGLFRGLGPNLVGVAPSRAIYFWSYSTSKQGCTKFSNSWRSNAPYSLMSLIIGSSVVDPGHFQQFSKFRIHPQSDVISVIFRFFLSKFFL